jgi:hypothetical protein
MSKQILSAKQLLHQESVGVLSTHSVDVEGYPFGSIVPFVLNYEGEPIILISDIAQHTRNIQQNHKVSLTVFDRGAADAQASSRLTWIGDAQPVDPADAQLRRRYLRYFPAAAAYLDMHDFSLYQIHLQKARFIGGFGQIFWVEPEAMLSKNPFRETEGYILEHMNQGHKDALLHYCKVLKGVDVKSDALTMTGIDREGFDMVAEGRKLRISFDSPVQTVAEARAALISLTRL